MFPSLWNGDYNTYIKVGETFYLECIAYYLTQRYHLTHGILKLRSRMKLTQHFIITCWRFLVSRCPWTWQSGLHHGGEVGHFSLEVNLPSFCGNVRAAHWTEKILFWKMDESTGNRTVCGLLLGRKLQGISNFISNYSQSLTDITWENLDVL